MVWLQRGLLILTLVFAGLTLFLAMKIQEVPLPDQFELPNGFSTPILAMEFPRDAADLAFIRGLENEDMRRHIYVVQYIDQYFPWAYAGLLGFFITFLQFRDPFPLRNRMFRMLGVVVFGVMVPATIIMADLHENAMIDIVFHPQAMAEGVTDRVAEWITREAWMKWSLIATAILIIVGLLIANRHTVLGLAALVPVLATLYARFIDPTGPAIEFMAQIIAVFFLAIPLMAVYFLVQSFRRTEPANESPRQVES